MKNRLMDLTPSGKNLQKWILLGWLTAGLILGGCGARPAGVVSPPPAATAQIPAGLSAAEAATLASLQQVDGYPLYTMVYQGEYSSVSEVGAEGAIPPDRNGFACSLFAVFGNPDDMLLGRNFDWEFSPALLLYTDPPDGFASVSVVDIAYLGFDGERAFGITELPLEDRMSLLNTPYLPFDGMNEAGLAVGMAAVPEGRMPMDPAKETVDSLLVIRMILDQAATLEEGVAILENLNIDWGNGPSLHYLIADRSGHSALVEFSGGELTVIANEAPWQPATNFLVSEATGKPAAQCWRYALIEERLEEHQGKLSAAQAMELLQDVSQDSTQWSVVYRISSGEVRIAMGRDYQNFLEFDSMSP